MLLLGGSFDPVHAGHIGLARYFSTLLHPDELRLIPAGQPWQKPQLRTPAEHRIAMLTLAFADWPLPVVIDDQEIRRTGPSYTVDTLQSLRASLGEQTSLVLVIGADQLANLPTWHRWTELFGLAHLAIAARPGFVLDTAGLPAALAAHLMRRRGSAAQLRESAAGLCFIAYQLALAVSSTAIRAQLQANGQAPGLLPDRVLDYVRQHHLYQNT